MKMKMLLIGVLVGGASLLLPGCATPKGGAEAEELSTLEKQDQKMVNSDEGSTPAPMNTPNMPAGINPRDLRDPQALTIPHPPIGPWP